MQTLNLGQVMAIPGSPGGMVAVPVHQTLGWQIIYGNWATGLPREQQRQHDILHSLKLDMVVVGSSNPMCCFEIGQRCFCVGMGIYFCMQFAELKGCIALVI